MRRILRPFNLKWLITLIGVEILLTAPLMAATVRVSWNPNSELDLAGYKIYYGTTSRVYTVNIDVGNVTQYDIGSLTVGRTYYFAVTAYDLAGNESTYSTEESFFIEDINPPDIVSADCSQSDMVIVVFNEPLEEGSAELTNNYSVDGGIVVQSAELQSDGMTVYLYTTQHPNGDYTLTVNNVLDTANVNNEIAENTQVAYSWDGNDEAPPQIVQVELYHNDFLVVTYSEAVDQNSAQTLANYSISPSVNVTSAGIDISFTKVYLTTGTHTPGQSYTLIVNNVQDGANPPNTIASNTQVNYDCIAEDTNPPVLLAARIQSATELELEFDESLDATTAQTESNYSISPSVTVTNAVVGGSGKIVTLTTAQHAGGTYTITVNGVTDDANPPNSVQSAQLQYTYTPPDVTPPTLVSAELTGDDLLRVIFSEPVNETSAENIGNYSIQPSVNITRATLDVSQVEVLLETAPHAGGDYRVNVSGVRDQADVPNVIASGSYVTYLYDPPDTSPPRLVSAELRDANLVELIFSEALDRTSSENVNNYVITSSIDILGATLNGDSLNRVFLETSTHEPGKSYIVHVSNILDRASVPNMVTNGAQAAYDYALVDNTPPRLESVELQSDRFLKLNFSESMDNVSAQNIVNYTIDPSVVVKEAILDAYLKTVLLKTERHQPGEYTVTVTGVTDRGDPPNAIGTDNQLSYTCESQDVSPPILLRAEIHGNNVLELIFNEPLEVSSALEKSNYSIDNGVAIQKVKLSQSQMEVFLETTAHLQGTYTVTVNNVRDLATVPNTIQSDSWVTYSYTPTDAVAPALVSVTLINSMCVELNFSEMLDRISAENTSNYSISSGVVVERAILDYSGTRITLQTTAHIPGLYTITLNGIQDASAAKNTIDANTSRQYTYVTADKTPPYIVSAELKSDKMLVVKFSESLDRPTAQDNNNYVINNNVLVKSVYMASNDGQVILETSSHLAAGDYILTVNGVKDASTEKNAIAPYSQIQYTWNPPDTTGPEVISATLLWNNYLEIIFNEPVDAVESQKVGNYQIDPSVQVQSAVLDGSWKKVYLCTSPHTEGNYTITVFNVKDRAFTPNTIGSENKVEYSYTPPDTEPPALVSVQLRTHMCLALHFDEELGRASTENIDNYSITPNVEVKQVYLLSSLKTVHLETSGHQAGTNYTVQIVNIQDRAPTPNELTSPLTAEYTYTPPDTTSPKLLSVKLQGPNILELVFSEELGQTSAENRDNYNIDPSVEVLNALLDNVSFTRVYLETTTHMPGIGYEINVRNVKDRAPIPNTISSNTWLSYTMSTAGGSADNMPPQVARIDVISQTRIDIVFTEPVNATSAQNKDNYAITDGITVQSAVLDSDLVKVRLTTSEHNQKKSYDINVTNIQDIASQPNILSTNNSVRYIISKGVTLSNINRSDYDFYEHQIGGPSYVDRDYSIENAPEYFNGILQILTANDDKTSSQQNFITFELRGDATVYVAHDKRIAQKPDWLSAWKVTGEQVVDSRSNVFNIYSADVSGGRIALGGNCGSMDDNMYLVFVKPHFASGAVLASLSKSSYKTKHIDIGDVYYIDRDYKVSAIPDSLKGLLWIQTANDDKLDSSEDFLCFSLNWDSRIYVAYDENIPSLPRWLTEDEGWEMIDEQIVDSRGSRFDVFYKEYTDGDVVLGGNCGTMDDNMYLVLIQPTETLGGPPVDYVPGYFTLVQNYPNPFNPTTMIPFEVLRTGHVKLTIYNILGQRVKILVDENFGTDKVGKVQTVNWDGTDYRGNHVAGGLYLYRIEQGQFARTRRMILMR